MTYQPSLSYTIRQNQRETATIRQSPFGFKSLVKAKAEEEPTQEPSVTPEPLQVSGTLPETQTEPTTQQSAPKKKRPPQPKKQKEERPETASRSQDSAQTPPIDPEVFRSSDREELDNSVQKWMNENQRELRSYFDLTRDDPNAYAHMMSIVLRDAYARQNPDWPRDWLESLRGAAYAQLLQDSSDRSGKSRDYYSVGGWSKRVFGEKLTDNQMISKAASLVGARGLSNAVVNITRSDHDGVTFETYHPSLEKCKNILKTDPKGKPFIHLDYISVVEKGQGTAPRIVLSQLEALREQKMYLTALATSVYSPPVSNSNLPHGGFRMNGAQVWPLMGGDIEIDRMPEKLIRAVRSHKRDARTLKEVIVAPGGDRYWKFLMDQLIGYSKTAVGYAKLQLNLRWNPADDMTMQLARIYTESAIERGKKRGKKSMDVPSSKDEEFYADPGVTDEQLEEILNIMEEKRKTAFGQKSYGLRPTGTTPSLYTALDKIGEEEPKQLIQLPDVRQRNDFECGMSVTLSVLKHWNAGEHDPDKLSKILDTNRKTSTHPYAIRDYLKSLGLQVEDKDHLTLEDLKDYWEKGIPVICPIQEYGDPVEDEKHKDQKHKGPKAEFPYGHYVASVGVGMGQVFVQDPSIDNVLSGEHADATKGKMMIPAMEFLKVWHDKDKDGNEFIRYGIAVGPPVKGEKGQVLGSDTYMDVAITPRSGGPITGTPPPTDLKRPLWYGTGSGTDSYDFDSPQNRVKRLDKKSHEFSSTQFDLKDCGYSRSEGSPVPRIKKIQDSIADEDLTGDGREDKLHITVLYGLHTDNVGDVKRVVKEWMKSRHRGGITVKLGDVSVLPANDKNVQRGGDYQDVLKLDVESKDLHDLHNFLAENLEHTDTHSEYHPHLTLAYLVPGNYFRYVGEGLGGQEVSCTHLVFSDKSREKTVIDLYELSKENETKALKRSNAEGWGCESNQCEWSLFQAGDDNMDMEKPGGLTTIHDQEPWQRAMDDRFDRDEVEVGAMDLVRPSPYQQKGFSKPGLGNDYVFYRQSYDRWRTKPDVLGDRRVRSGWERGFPSDQLAIRNDEEFRLKHDNKTKESQLWHATHPEDLPEEAGLTPGKELEEDDKSPRCPDGSAINPATRTCAGHMNKRGGYPGADEMHLENDDVHVGGQLAGDVGSRAKVIRSSPFGKRKAIQEEGSESNKLKEQSLEPANVQSESGEDSGAVSAQTSTPTVLPDVREEVSTNPSDSSELPPPIDTSLSNETEVVPHHPLKAESHGISEHSSYEDRLKWVLAIDNLPPREYAQLVNNMPEEEYSVFNSTMERWTLTRLFGASVTDQSLRTKILPSIFGGNGSNYEVEFDRDSTRVTMDTDGVQGSFSLLIHRRTGKKYAINEEVYSESDTGKAVRAVINEVQFLSSNGFSHIETSAQSYDNGEDQRPLVGAGLWPCLGFNCKLISLPSDMRNAVREQYPEANSLIDIMMSPGGPKWWRSFVKRSTENSRLVHLDLIFDLDPQSLSYQYLDKYRRKKRGIKGYSMKFIKDDDSEASLGLSSEDLELMDSIWEEMGKETEEVKNVRPSPFGNKSAYTQKCPNGDPFPIGSGSCHGRQANSYDGLVDNDNLAPWGSYPDIAPVIGLDTRDPKDKEKPVAGPAAVVYAEAHKDIPTCPAGEEMSPNVRSCGGDEGWKSWGLTCPDGTRMSPDIRTCSGHEGLIPFTEEERRQETLFEPPKPGLQEIPSEGPLEARYPTEEETPPPASIRRSPFSKKALDDQGGEIPPPEEMNAAEKYDFITLPEDVTGTNCLNCTFVREKASGHICGHPKLLGLPVNEHNCCALWDNGEALRAWENEKESKAYNYKDEVFHPEQDNYRSLEAVDSSKEDSEFTTSNWMGESHYEKSAMSWLGSGSGGDLVAPPEFGGIRPKKKPIGHSTNNKMMDRSLSCLVRAKALPPLEHGHQPTLAVDVDGTLCDTPLHRGPPLSMSEMEPRPGAVEAMNHFHNTGWKILIWTCRDDLDEVEQWLKYHHIPFDHMNENPGQPTSSPKVMSHFYIDDRSLVPTDWEEVVREIDSARARQPVPPDIGYNKLAELSEQALPELEELLSPLGFPVIQLSDLDSCISKPGGLSVIAPIKAQPRAEEKVESDYDGDWSHLLDMVRATVAVDSLEDLIDVFSTLEDSGIIPIRKPKNRFKNPLPNGYRDYQINVKLPSGFICEIQFHLKKILASREREKLSYDVIRAIRAALKEEGRDSMTSGEAAAVQRARDSAIRLFEGAWQEYMDKEKKTKQLPFGPTPQAPKVPPSPFQDEHWHKSVVQYSIKASSPFTGERIDVTGRHYCYAGGVKVPCSKGEADEQDQTRPDSQTASLYEMAQAPSPAHPRPKPTKIKESEESERQVYAVIFNSDGNLLVHDDDPWGGFVWTGKKKNIKGQLEELTGLNLKGAGVVGDNPGEGKGYFIFQVGSTRGLRSKALHSKTSESQDSVESPSSLEGKQPEPPQSESSEPIADDTSAGRGDPLTDEGHSTSIASTDREIIGSDEPEKVSTQEEKGTLHPVQEVRADVKEHISHFYKRGDVYKYRDAGEFADDIADFYNRLGWDPNYIDLKVADEIVREEAIAYWNSVKKEQSDKMEKLKRSITGKIKEHERLSRKIADGFTRVLSPYDSDIGKLAFQIEDTESRLRQLYESGGGKADEFIGLRDKIFDLEKAQEEVVEKRQEIERKHLAEFLATGAGWRTSSSDEIRQDHRYDVVKEGMKFVRSIVSYGRAGHDEGGKVRVFAVPKDHYYGHRSFYQPENHLTPSGIYLADTAATKSFVHEFGHHLEDSVPEIHEAAVSFLLYRIKDEMPKRIKDVIDDSNYEDDEYGCEDEFNKSYNRGIYVGKVYDKDRLLLAKLDPDFAPKYIKSTEIISIGLQLLWSEASDFAKLDFEYFTFMIGICRGAYEPTVEQEMELYDR